MNCNQVSSFSWVNADYNALCSPALNIGPEEPLHGNNHLRRLLMLSVHATNQSQGVLKAILNQARLVQLITPGPRGVLWMVAFDLRPFLR